MTGLKVGSNYKQNGTSKELWQGLLLLTGYVLVHV